MEVEFRKPDLSRLETDAGFNGGFGADLVKKFRQRMQLIRAAVDERDFYAMKSLHFEKLKGDREHQRSMRLNIQWRLILEIKESKPKNSVVIVDIEDYH